MSKEPLAKGAVKTGPVKNCLLCRLFVATFLLSLASGCASYPARPVLSESKELALGVNKLGNSAFKRGNYREALTLYNEALRYNRSIEDRDGIAINMINLAATYRKLEGYESAHEHADAILSSSGIEFAALHLAEASYIKALLYADRREFESAVASIENGMQFCSKAGCDSEGRFYNLLARIAAQKGEPEKALVYAKRGLVLSRRHDDLREVANALRLVADTKREMKLYGGTGKLYEEALATDKELGLADKIAADLRGLGHLFFEQDRFEDALRYFNRALSVSENTETDEEGIALASELIEKCRERLKDRK